MTSTQRNFLDELAMLMQAHNVSCLCANNDEVIIEFEHERSMSFMEWNGITKIFRDVVTKSDYKPSE